MPPSSNGISPYATTITHQQPVPMATPAMSLESSCHGNATANKPPQYRLHGTSGMLCGQMASIIADGHKSLRLWDRTLK